MTAGSTGTTTTDSNGEHVTEEQVAVASVGGNWAGNLAYGARGVAAPSSIDELAELLQGADPFRPLGTRHAFNDIADTTGTLVSTVKLPEVVEIDAARRTVRVSAAIRYGDLAPRLASAGWALANLASLPHISVAGAVATGTHGSGDRVGSLASAVSGLELVGTDGRRHELRRGDPDFDGAVVSLGALGVVTEVELDIEPAFEVAQTVYEGLDWNEVLGDLDAVTSLGYSVSLFTSWRSADRIDQLWVKHRTDHEERDVPFARATRPRHPLEGISAEHTTEQLGVAGAWFDRLPHFRLDFTPSNGEELQSEYLVPREHAAAALEAVRGLADRIAPLIHVCEIRTVAADELWLSSAYGTGAVGIHFTWRPVQPAVEALLPTIEAALEPFGARPHWGKLFTMPGERMPQLYPRWHDFAALRGRFDPRGALRNPFLERLGL